MLALTPALCIGGEIRRQATSVRPIGPTVGDRSGHRLDAFDACPAI